MLHRIGTALVVLLALACASAVAWAGNVGPQFRVNTHTTGDQRDSSIAALSNGGFVVVWKSFAADASHTGIFGQRFNSTGGRVGGEFRVSIANRPQDDPSVAALGTGGFVVVWSGKDQEASGWAVFLRRYDAGGASVGSILRVNTHTADDQDRPSIAALSNGGFVVTWTSFRQDGSGSGVYAQRYTAAGARAGTEFRVNTRTTSHQAGPSVARLNDGGFLVAWASDQQDSSERGVYRQRFGSAGGRALGEYRVNTHQIRGQYGASAAGLSNGGFVIAWTSDWQDGDSGGVYGQRYSADGTLFGAEFRVNTLTLNHQWAPSVAGLSTGGFVVAWNTRDNSGMGISAQRYNALLARSGSEFRVNAETMGDQSFPSVAGLSTGGSVITWHSRYQDGSGYGVYGQRYTP